MAEDPLPLLRWYVSLYRSVTGRAFSDADPFELIEIDPLDVTYVSNRAKGWDSWLGEVVGGDWDRQSVRTDEIPLVPVLTAHIRDGEPLDCAAYREYYPLERRGTDPFEVRCLQVENLVWDISYYGYRSQRELIDSEGIYALQGQNNDTVHPLLNEIRVDIDRHGRFHHWRCGLHRLTIARALGIERVPVLVGTRHAEWQAVRDQFRRASSVEDLPDGLREHVGHPDLRGLLSTPERESVLEPASQAESTSKPEADRTDTSQRSERSLSVTELSWEQ